MEVLLRVINGDLSTEDIYTNFEVQKTVKAVRGNIISCSEVTA
jgi:hypothetical protein